MEKLPMCRICLVEGVRMYVVVNKKLHELYEKLTDVPFITKDRRPMLACFFCCAKLKQCWRFLKKCLEAEELFTQMMKEDYEQEPLVNSERLELFCGFINSPIVHISISDGGQIESDAIKEELPDVTEGLDDIFDTLTENDHQANELKLDDIDNSYPDVADAPVLHAESDYEGVPLKEIKSEVEDEPETTGASFSKKSKLDTQSPRDTIPVEQKKNEKSPKLSCVTKITLKKIQNHMICQTTEFKVPLTKTQHEVSCSVNNTDLSTSSPSNSNRDEIKCKISNKGVDSDNTQKYRRVRAKEKRFKCYVCQRSFSAKYNLTCHIRTHTGEKLFKCDICQRSFVHKSNLVVHTRTHTGEKPFKCNICQRSFARNHDLIYHNRVHTDEKPYKCDICQRSFSVKLLLTRHVGVHSSDKPFKCDVCHYRFSQKYHLTNHIRTHTGEKPFKCDVCQRSFNQKSILTCHIRTHTGEKPFKCDICQRGFIKKYFLVRHTKIHTRDKHIKCEL